MVSELVCSFCRRGRERNEIGKEEAKEKKNSLSFFPKKKKSTSFFSPSLQPLPPTTQVLRQVNFALSDLFLHAEYDPAAHAATGGVYGSSKPLQPITDATTVMAPLDEDRFLAAFSHIFAGGYSAGYFSYLWAEVLSADCFGRFEEEGLDDEAAVKAAGKDFAETVLALGGGLAPAEVFKRFRGRDPTPDALLRHKGLVAAA